MSIEKARLLVGNEVAVQYYSRQEREASDRIRWLFAPSEPLVSVEHTECSCWKQDLDKRRTVRTTLEDNIVLVVLLGALLHAGCVPSANDLARSATLLRA